MAKIHITPDEQAAEGWAPIPSTGGVYFASDKGRIRKGQSILACFYDSKGYRWVALFLGSGRSARAIHRLVSEAFRGPCPPGMQVNHRDGAKTNNRLPNLEYVTPRQNREHALKHGLAPVGDECGYSRLTADNVRVVRDMLARGVTQTAVAAAFGVATVTIGNIARGKSWRFHA